MTYKRSDGLVLSAISSRPFLANIITQIMPLLGKSVFEIGSGTGYLAAVMSVLCGPEGRVAGCEIIRDLFELSLVNLRKQGIDNVTLHYGDFLQVLSSPQVFDVVLATSSMSMLHERMLTSCRNTGGRILLPVEIPGGGDCFTIFSSLGDRLRVEYSVLSVSVPTTGSYSYKPIWAPPVGQLLPGWKQMKLLAIRTTGNYVHFIHETLPFRSFLLFNEPLFRAVSLRAQPLAAAADMAFGFVCEKSGSCCLQTSNTLLVGGVNGLKLAHRFGDLQRSWEGLAKPSLKDYIYEIRTPRSGGFEFVPGFRRRVDILQKL
jgi:protein-L-isoaspartate O-methyltransferase